nr:hypothetical protein [uncultured bacterium]
MKKQGSSKEGISMPSQGSRSARGFQRISPGSQVILLQQFWQGDDRGWPVNSAA